MKKKILSTWSMHAQVSNNSSKIPQQSCLVDNWIVAQVLRMHYYVKHEEACFSKVAKQALWNQFHFAEFASNNIVV